MPLSAQQLLSNLAESEVECAFQSHGVLVRGCSSGTDIGIDRYCETTAVQSPQGGPEGYLHFWIQIKAGDQVKELKSGQASVPVKAGHLRYWWRQPVPVFVVGVPVLHPNDTVTHFYVVDLIRRGIEGPPFPRGAPGALKRVHSHYRVDMNQPGGEGSIRYFLEETLPTAYSLSFARFGVARPRPHPDTTRYIVTWPTLPMPVERACLFANQAKDGAVIALISAWQFGSLAAQGMPTVELKGVLDAVLDENHWQPQFARGLAAHAVGDWARAESHFRSALSCLQRDPRLGPDSRTRKVHGGWARACAEAAAKGQALPGPAECPEIQ